MNELPLGFGAHASEIIGNEIQHTDLVKATVAPPSSFEIVYDFPHYNQNRIGICTAIDLADMMQKVWGIPFSSQFIYNIGKKMYDGNVYEGSSIKTMLRVVNNYGAAPLSLVPTDDTTKSYEQYVDDWFTPEAFAEAKKYKMNYGVARLDPVGFAADLSTSKYGLMTRMATGSEWYTAKNGMISYNPADIDPLRAPHPVEGGHSVKCRKYIGLGQDQRRTLRNTWGDKDNPIMPGGAVWCDNGDIDYVYSTLQPYVTEAWAITKPIPDLPLGFTFKKDLQFGMVDIDVKHLQMYLNTHGFPVSISGVGSAGNEGMYFGSMTKKALASFQAAHGITPSLGYLGTITRTYINSHQ